ncbi:superinfection immunity protein [Streptomyces sp. NPDC001941]|uniref:superinfection immunity protein n=1 Tax=Streptomyces sp. NPDC001941 TaxID=3154659 RepID=UPI00331923B7
MEITLAVPLAIVLMVVYLLPSLIAFNRTHEKRWLILAVNVLLGGSGIGWGIALYLALRKPRTSPELGRGTLNSAA